jgi:hypothetical protein
MTNIEHDGLETRQIKCHRVTDRRRKLHRRIGIVRTIRVRAIRNYEWRDQIERQVTTRSDEGRVQTLKVVV